MDRRQFLKLSSGALGGAILSGCQFPRISDSTVITNGYYFYRLKSTGESVGSDERSFNIYEFGGSSHISDNAVITFDAYDMSGNHGLFQLDLDFLGHAPICREEYSALLSGDTLSDGREVRDFGAHDVNTAGNIVAVIHAKANSEHAASGVYLDESRAGFEAVLTAGTRYNEGAFEATGIIGDVSLEDDNSMLIVANHRTETGPQNHLVHLPAANLHSANPLLSSEDLLASSDEQITDFGLISHNASGYFSVTVSHTLSTGVETSATANSSTNPINSLVYGHVDNPEDHLLLSAGPSFTESTHTAHIHYGPRVASDGTVYSKIVYADEERLIAGDSVIKTSSDTSSSGATISSFTPGCVGADDIFYYTEYTEQEGELATSLYAYDGNGHQLVLASGDSLTDGGAEVSQIYFASSTNHVDAQGRLVLICEFSDKSSAVVIGIPA